MRYAFAIEIVRKCARLTGRLLISRTNIGLLYIARQNIGKGTDMTLRLPTIYVVRHCRTGWNTLGLLQGMTDVPLSEEGRGEALRNIDSLRPLDISRIFTSNRKRAEQTADIYSQALGVPCKLCKEFNELDHGDWEGKSFKDLQSDAQYGYSEWFRNPANSPIPGSEETAESAQQRAVKGIRKIVRSRPGETILVISHKHMLALLMCAQGAALLQAQQEACLCLFEQMIDESTEPRRLLERFLISLVECNQP